jgi:hypothetical protein
VGYSPRCGGAELTQRVSHREMSGRDLNPAYLRYRAIEQVDSEFIAMQVR